MGRMCCCGGGSYNLVYFDRETGSTGKQRTISTEGFPSFEVELFNKRNRKWVHAEPKSLSNYIMRERLNDIHVVNGDIYCEVDYDISQDGLTYPDNVNRLFNISVVNPDGRTKWTSDDTVLDLFQELNAIPQINYQGRKVSGILPNNNLVYLTATVDSSGLDMVCVNPSGGEVWRVDLFNSGVQAFFSIRTGNKILLLANIPSSTLPPSVLGTRVYDINGTHETDIVDNVQFSGIHPVGMIDDFIYTTKFVSIQGNSQAVLQKRSGDGTLISEIDVANGYKECYGNYIWEVAGDTGLQIRVINIYDEDLNLVLNFDTEINHVVFGVARVLPIENDGIYITGGEGKVFKHSWDGDVIWRKDFESSDTTDPYGTGHNFFGPLNMGLDVYSDTKIVVGGNTFSTNDVYQEQNP